MASGDSNPKIAKQDENLGNGPARYDGHGGAASSVQRFHQLYNPREGSCLHGIDVKGRKRAIVVQADKKAWCSYYFRPKAGGFGYLKDVIPTAGRSDQFFYGAGCCIVRQLLNVHLQVQAFESAIRLFCNLWSNKHT
jgi:hypothetical protein